MSDRLKEESITLKTSDEVPEAEGDPRQLIKGVEITELCSQNPNAAVYKGKILSSEKHVAVKVTLAPVTDQDFEQFSKVASLLQHPPHHGIAKVHSFGRLADGKMYVVSDWLDWDSLRSSNIMRGQIDNRVASIIISEVCDALEQAHSKGIAHGSLRPENIFIKVDGKEVQVKIVDFGWHFVQPLESNSAKVTDVYLSPEVRLCRMVDARSDVFSLAAIVYNMAMGQHLPVISNESLFMKGPMADPLGLLDQQQLAYQSLKQMSSCVRKMPTTNVKALDALLQQALQPNPSHRPQSAVEFKHTIQHAIFSKAPIGTGLQKAVNPRSQKWIPITMGIVALAACIAFAVVVQLTEANKPAPVPVPTASPISRPAPQPDVVREPVAAHFSPMTGPADYRFSYALLAKKGVTISGIPDVAMRTALDQRRQQRTRGESAERPLIGAFGDIVGSHYVNAVQTAKAAGGQLFQAAYCSTNMRGPLRLDSGKLFVPEFPSKPAMSPPSGKKVVRPTVADRTWPSVQATPTATEICDLRGLPTRLSRLELGAGDYIVDSLPRYHARLNFRGPSGHRGPIRFFIPENSPGPIEISMHGNTQNRPQDFQIWYNGSGTVKIDGDVTGVVYAPNAKVVVDGISTVIGAVVADSIEMKGISHVYYDPALMELTDWSKPYISDTHTAPFLAYAALARDSVQFEQDATIGQIGGGAARSAVAAGKTVHMDTTSRNLSVETSQISSMNIPAAPAVPPGPVKVVSPQMLHSETVLSPAPGETFDLGEVELSRSITLRSGNYRMSQLKILAGGGINVQQEQKSKLPVRIFLDDRGSDSDVMDLEDASLGAGTIPANFQIYYNGHKKIRITGNSWLSGVLYAPNAKIEVTGTSAIEGAIVGGGVRFENRARLMYDDSLASRLNWGADVLPKRGSAAEDE